MSNFPPWNGQQEMSFGQPMQMDPYHQRTIYQPQMQPMHQQYQQPAPMQQQPQEQFFCRPVASAEEARGIPVDFSGRPMFFPHLNAGRIYLKVFDTGNGSAIFREFRMVEPDAEAQPGVAFAPMSELEGLRAMVVELQNELRTMKASKRKNAQEVALNDE